MSNKDISIVSPGGIRNDIDPRALVIGLAVGVVTEASNLLPNDGLLGLSFIAGAFGFWIFSVTVAIVLSRTNSNAAINTFLYLAGMVVSYYLLQGVIDWMTPDVAVEHFIHWDHLAFWLAAAAGCAAVAFVLYFWNSGRPVLSAILCALPVAAMLADTVNAGMKFYYSGMHLLGLILDAAFLVAMLIILFRKAGVKPLNLICVVLFAGAISFSGVIQSDTVTTQARFQCELDGVTQEFYVVVRDDGEIIEMEGDPEVFEVVGASSCSSAPEIVHAFQDYYESRGGSCETL